MADENAKGPSSRQPTLDDLVLVCRKLNESGARYVVIGGFAVNYYGYPRGTADIDLLVESSADNLMKVKEALSFLPDNAVRLVSISDMQEYGVLRIADEVVVDILKEINGVKYEHAEIEKSEHNGVVIPVAAVKTLIKTKELSARPRDKDDIVFLKIVEREEKSRGR